MIASMRDGKMETDAGRSRSLSCIVNGPFVFRVFVFRTCLFACLFVAFTLPTSFAFSQSPNSVNFQIGYPANLPVGVAQQWLTVLKEAGADRIRLKVDPQQKLSIDQETIKSRTVITVFASINPKQELAVKGKVFSLRNRDSVRMWIDQLRNTKPADLEQSRGAFGLTADELVKVYEVLGKPFPHRTRGQTAVEVVKKIRQELGVKIAADSAAMEALREGPKEEALIVPEELEGLSCGTVLANVIRPLGLVLVIRDRGRQFGIVSSRSASEHWPIGWPVQKRPSQIAPALFRQTEVEIEGFQLDEVLRSIEAKIEIPMLFDQNAMARHGIELEKVEVNLGRQKTYYDKLIRKCLSFAKPGLKTELRADESGQPFLWISR